MKIVGSVRVVEAGGVAVTGGSKGTVVLVEAGGVMVTGGSKDTVVLVETGGGTVTGEMKGTVEVGEVRDVAVVNDALVLGVCDTIVVASVGESGSSSKGPKSGQSGQTGIAVPNTSADSCASYGSVVMGQDVSEDVVTLEVVVGSRSHPVVVSQLVV